MDTPELPPLRLVPELVPTGLWGLSAARLLPRTQWDRIRKAERAAAGDRCTVCGAAPKRLICHERWLRRVEDHQGSVTLAALRIQCGRCDRATHVGLAESQGKLQVARHQLAAVNDIDLALADALIEGAYELQARQSRVTEWQIDVSVDLIDRHPALEALPDLMTAAARRRPPAARAAPAIFPRGPERNR